MRNATCAMKYPSDFHEVQGGLCVPRGEGAKLSLKAHLCIYMFLHSSRFRSINSFPEEQSLAY